MTGGDFLPTAALDAFRPEAESAKVRALEGEITQLQAHTDALTSEDDKTRRREANPTVAADAMNTATNDADETSAVATTLVTPAKKDRKQESWAAGAGGTAAAEGVEDAVPSETRSWSDLPQSAKKHVEKYLEEIKVLEAQVKALREGSPVVAGDGGGGSGG